MKTGTNERIPGDPALYEDYVAGFLKRRQALLDADPDLAFRVGLAELETAVGDFMAVLDETARQFADAMAPLAGTVAALFPDR